MKVVYVLVLVSLAFGFLTTMFNSIGSATIEQKKFNLVEAVVFLALIMIVKMFWR